MHGTLLLVTRLENYLCKRTKIIGKKNKNKNEKKIKKKVMCVCVSSKFCVHCHRGKVNRVDGIKVINGVKRWAVCYAHVANLAFTYSPVFFFFSACSLWFNWNLSTYS